jgi:type II secretory pathway component HofQ
VLLFVFGPCGKDKTPVQTQTQPLPVLEPLVRVSGDSPHLLADINVKDAEVRQFLTVVSKTYSVKVTAADSVQGKVTIHENGIRLTDLLDKICDQLPSRCGYTINANVYHLFPNSAGNSQPEPGDDGPNG